MPLCGSELEVMAVRTERNVLDHTDQMGRLDGVISDKTKEVERLAWGFEHGDRKNSGISIETRTF